MSAKNSSHDVASRYTTAFLALAEEKGVSAAVANDLSGLKTVLGESADLERLISNPLLTRAEQSRAIIAVAEKAGASPLMQNFLGVLADNRRLGNLPELVDYMLAEISRRKGEVVADVVTAETLSEGQVQKLTEALKSALHADVLLHLTQNASLLGGMTVKVGSRMVDLSVRSRLDRLQRALKSDPSSEIESQRKKVKEVA